MKTLELEVWVGQCAKAHSGYLDADLVNVAIKGLSLCLPNVQNLDQPICSTDYRKACFYLDDWTDIISNLSSYKQNYISCRVHFDTEDNVHTLSGRICADMLECLADGKVIDFDDLDVGLYEINSYVVGKKPDTKFELRIGFLETGCEMRETNTGLPHDDILSQIVCFPDCASAQKYIECWGAVFEFFGRQKNDMSTKVFLNINSLNRIFKYEKCMKLLSELRQSYSKDIREFPKNCL